jgi:hypothetical protein
VVHARKVDDRELSFIVSGKLWRNSLVMQDRETNSLWSHITGECLEGELVGTQLEMIPMVQTTWKEWVAAHPETRVLKKDEEVLSSRYERYFTDPERTGMFRAQWLREKMPGKDLVQGIVIGPHALAVRDDGLPPGAVREGEVGEVPMKITRGADGGVRAWRTDTDEELRVLQAFWFAWSTYYPRTGVMD